MLRTESLVTLLLAVLAASCTAARPLEEQRLPFRIALVPLADPVVGTTSAGELPGEPTELRLELGPEELTEAVREALESYCFGEVEVLDLGDATAVLDGFERERRILDGSRAASVDLVVELTLRYDPEVYRKNASTFWLNYPLFLFAGPSNWFVRDNGYYADVELLTEVYDCNSLEAGGFGLGDPAARVVSASSRFNGTELDFRDRSDGVGDYLMGVVVPSGFLSRESASTEEAVRRAVIEELGYQVVRGLQSRSDDLVRAPWIAPVYLDPDEVEVTRNGSEVRVRGLVRLDAETAAAEVRGVRLDAGAGAVRVSPEDAFADAGDSGRVLAFDAVLQAAPDATSVRVVCEAGARDRYFRSYTFPLPDSLAP